MLSLVGGGMDAKLQSIIADYVIAPGFQLTALTNQTALTRTEMLEVRNAPFMFFNPVKYCSRIAE